MARVTCTVGTPDPTDLIVDGFGLVNGAHVKVDPSGTLGGGVTATVDNNDTTVLPAGYSEDMEIDAMGLRVVGGQAAFVRRTTIFRCHKSGPAVGPGQTNTIAFIFGVGGCPPLPGVLPCGLYRARLTIRGTDAHGRRFQRQCTLYYHVPSSVTDIDINVTINPEHLLLYPECYDPVPPIPPAGPGGFVREDADDRFNLIAPCFASYYNDKCALDPTPPFPGVCLFRGKAFTIIVTLVGAPGSLYILRGRDRSDVPSGSTVTFQPQLPIGNPMGVPGPTTIDLLLAVPRCKLMSPCTDIGPPPNYNTAINLDTVITAVSIEPPPSRTIGCVIRQKTLKTRVYFECN